MPQTSYSPYVQHNCDLRVAVLLATHNGAQFVDAQILSLRDNRTCFELHWLDDHSQDATREIVRASATKALVDLHECHQIHKQGWPASYFQLLETVDADIYLFCDQDDIWQPGKIDATVDNLVADLQVPTLCFSDPLLFDEDNPEIRRPLTETLGFTASQALDGFRSFVFAFSFGHTVGFTRPLRDIVVNHVQAARNYAAGHDMWLYLIAYSVGRVKFLPDVPTTLYRIHGGNTAGYWLKHLRWTGFRHCRQKWQFIQKHRSLFSRQATGFVQAARSLPYQTNKAQMVEIATLVSHLEERLSLLSIVSLIRLKSLPPRFDLAATLVLACLVSNARGSAVG